VWRVYGPIFTAHVRSGWEGSRRRRPVRVKTRQLAMVGATPVSELRPDPFAPDRRRGETVDSTNRPAGVGPPASTSVVRCRWGRSSVSRVGYQRNGLMAVLDHDRFPFSCRCGRMDWRSPSLPGHQHSVAFRFAFSALNRGLRGLISGMAGPECDKTTWITIMPRVLVAMAIRSGTRARSHRRTAQPS